MYRGTLTSMDFSEDIPGHPRWIFEGLIKWRTLFYGFVFWCYDNVTRDQSHHSIFKFITTEGVQYK